MRLKQVLKIVLLVVSILFAGFVIALMYTVLYIENSSFEYTMLIPLFMIPTGVLSVIYHFKTLKFYSLKTNAKGFKDPVLWIGNALFGVSQVLTALYLSYSLFMIYQSKQNIEQYIALSVCLTMMIFGSCLLVETYHLYKRIIKKDEDLFKGSIDDIKGVDEERD